MNQDDPELTRELAQLGTRFSGLLTIGRLTCTLELNQIQDKLEYIHGVGSLTQVEHYERTKDLWQFMSKLTDIGKQMQECMHKAHDAGILARLSAFTE
jgi:hypothetical protein